MVVKVIYQLSRSKLVNHVELNTARKGLPFEVIELVKGIGLLPTIRPELQALPYNIAVVAWTDYKLRSAQIFVHQRVNSC